MPLQGFTSLCKERQGKIVSKDKGNQRKHVANNIRSERVAHYQIDGDVIRSNDPKCDFLLLNEDTATAYLIELKGRDIRKAIEQLENTERLLVNELKPYQLRFRIVCSKAKTHAIHDSRYIKYSGKRGTSFQCKVNVIEEDL